MIYADGKIFLIQTRKVSYLFRKLESGHLEHIHFGGSIFSEDKYESLKGEIDLGAKDKELLEQTVLSMAPKHFFGGGNMNYYSDEFQSTCLEMLGLEMSSFGKGDIREPMVELVYPDGSSTVDFVFDDYQVRKGKKDLDTLPSSYDDQGHAQQLVVKLVDKEYNTRLDLIYSVFPDCDVITRSAVLYNDGEEPVKVERLLSTSVDFYDHLKMK